MFLKAIFSFIIAHLFFFGFNTKVYVAPTPTSTTTPATLSSTTKSSAISTTTIPKSAKATTTPKIKVPLVIKTEKPLAIQATTTTPEPPADFAAINTYARGAIVNIFCTANGDSLSPISGTGVVVSPSGLILTNAHIAEYFLLKDFREKDFIKCVARTGSPAYPKYNLELVYISPTWVTNNKDLLLEENPVGTGEDDFAFLRITDAIDGSSLPENFPFIPMDIREIINVGEPALLVSYPAGFLGGITVSQNLSITSAIAEISQIFTFKLNTIDLISVPGTVVSQKGSSGGAVVDKNATLIGIISTSSGGDTTSQRDLRAITLAYINREMQNEIGITLSQFVSQDSASFAKKFQEINAPSLSKLIEDELNK